MTIVNVAEFAPDMPDVPSTATDTAFNVVPATGLSYGPMQSFSSYATALTARCQGAISITDTSGNVRIFSGDASKLYRLTAASTTPSDVSKTGGYSTPSTGGWSYAVFGERVIATNYNDPPQSYTEGTSTQFANLITAGLTSLKAKYVTSVRDWVVFANTTDSTYGTRPQRVHWTAIDDPTNIPTPGTQAAANALSDFQDMPGTHGEIKGIVGNLGTADAAIFFERAVYRMTYSGLPFVFDFTPVQGAIGLLTAGGLTQFGSTAYYWGEDGFYAFDGSTSIPIGVNKIDKYVYNDLDPSYIDRITCSVDPVRKMIVWAYCGAGSSNGMCNRLLFYSVPLGRWTITEANAVSIQSLVRAATFGKTLEQLNSFGTLDGLQFSLDSSVWSGGRGVLGAFDSSHRFGYFSGENMAARVDTSDMEIFSGQQTCVNRVRPLTETTAATVTAFGRDRVQDAVSGGSSGTMEPNGSVAVRSRGRYHRFRIEIPAGETWTHIAGIDVEEAQRLGYR